MNNLLVLPFGVELLSLHLSNLHLFFNQIFRPSESTYEVTPLSVLEGPDACSVGCL
jgi:hypothetical protein